MLVNQNTPNIFQENPIRTFDINQAAEFLGAHKETVRRMVVLGELPGVKIGRSWRFIEQDLVIHMRNKYSIRDVSQGDHYRSNDKWRSKEKTVFGGLTSPTLENAYEKALKLS